jgi:hypothetical protein
MSRTLPKTCMGTSRRRDPNPRPPLYESAQRGETEDPEGSSEGINALQIRLF